MNLLDDAWIPVWDQDGQWRELGLLDVMRKASTLGEVAAESADQTRGIYRLLIAVVYHAFPGRTWDQLLAAGGLPVDEICSYLVARRGRFDLEVALQYASQPSSDSPTTGLDRLMWPDGPYPVGARVPAAVPAAVAARQLLARMLFDPSGIRTGLADDPMSSSGGKSMPIGPAHLALAPTTLVIAPTLAETLAWNLPSRPSSPGAGVEDTPLWDDDPARPRGSYKPGQVGAGRVLVWPSRRLLLRHSPDGQEVTGAVLANGDRLELDNLHTVEPHGLWRQKNPPAPDNGGERKRRRSKDGKPLPIRPRRPEQLHTVWEPLIDRGGPRPIGLQRLFNPPQGVTPPETMRVETVTTLLGPHGSTIIDITATSLQIDTRKLGDRLKHLPLLDEFITTTIGYLLQAHLARNPYLEDQQALREDLTARHTATIAPVIDAYLIGDPLDHQQLSQWVHHIQQELENLTTPSKPEPGQHTVALPAILDHTYRKLTQKLTHNKLIPQPAATVQ